MALKKAPTPKPAPTTALANWDEELAKHAVAAAAVTGNSTGTFISFRGGTISINKTPVKGNVLEVVAVGHIFENAMYEGVFDPDNPQPPVCYAFGTDPEEMQPHKDSAKPQGLDEYTEEGSPRDKDGNTTTFCKNCWANEFGSAEKGKGKACKNMRRIAVIAGDEESLQKLEEEKLEFMKTTVTSASTWDDYVKELAANLKRPPFAVITKISAAPDPKTQFRQTFSLKQPIEDGELFGRLITKHKEAMNKLPFPYPKPSDEPPAPNRTSNKFAGRGKPAAKAGRR